MSLEFGDQKEKKGATIAVRLEYSQHKDLLECAACCGFEDYADYVRAALYFAKPIMLRLKSDPSLVLSIVSQMVKVK